MRQSESNISYNTGFYFVNKPLLEDDLIENEPELPPCPSVDYAVDSCLLALESVPLDKSLVHTQTEDRNTSRDMQLRRIVA